MKKYYGIVLGIVGLAVLFGTGLNAEVTVSPGMKREMTTKTWIPKTEIMPAIPLVPVIHRLAIATAACPYREMGTARFETYKEERFCRIPDLPDGAVIKKITAYLEPDFVGEGRTRDWIDMDRSYLEFYVQARGAESGRLTSVGSNCSDGVTTRDLDDGRDLYVTDFPEVVSLTCRTPVVKPDSNTDVYIMMRTVVKAVSGFEGHVTGNKYNRFPFAHVLQVEYEGGS